MWPNPREHRLPSAARLGFESLGPMGMEVEEGVSQQLLWCGEGLQRGLVSAERKKQGVHKSDKSKQGLKAAEAGTGEELATFPMYPTSLSVPFIFCGGGGSLTELMKTAHLLLWEMGNV